MNGIKVWLFSNRFITFQNDPQKGKGLFDLPETKELYLMQGLKDVDYIIKIDSGIEDQLMIDRMKSISQVSCRYCIDQSRFNIDLSINLQ